MTLIRWESGLVSRAVPSVALNSRRRRVPESNLDVYQNNSSVAFTKGLVTFLVNLCSYLFTLDLMILFLCPDRSQEFC